MPRQTIPDKRMEEWLEQAALPEDAQICIENFVISCDMAKEDDALNFIYIDIINFEPEVQTKLIEGFFYSYFGIKPVVYYPNGMPDYHVVNLI